MPGRRTLIEPGDSPNRDEEAAIDNITVRRMDRVAEVDWRLRNSSERTVRYEAALKAAKTPEQITKAARDLEVERAIQERILAEREIAAR